MEQIWLIILKAEPVFGPQTPAEVARFIATTPTSSEPEFNLVMDGVDGLGIGRRYVGYALTYDIGYIFPDKAARDKTTTRPDWSGENLKLWIFSRAENAKP